MSPYYDFRSGRQISDFLVCDKNHFCCLDRLGCACLLRILVKLCFGFRTSVHINVYSKVVNFKLLIRFSTKSFS